MNSKNDLIKDFDLLIQAWTESDNENTTHLANVLADHVIKKSCDLYDVTHQNELLSAFNEWLNDNHRSFRIPDMIIQDYIC